MSDPNDVRDDRLYTSDHEWARDEGSALAIGITAYAVDQLGDVTLVDLSVKPGDALAAGQAFGTIESVKTLSDLYAPLAGTVARVNEDLAAHPELVNEDCWGRAWMVAIRPTSADTYDALLPADGYGDLVKAG